MTNQKEKFNLHLQHNNIPSHNEFWMVRGNQVHVKSVCPMNHPSISNHTLTKEEALRQYALMTSEAEGWRLESSDEVWHSFIEA